jgi:hypothetical protein
MLAHEFGRFGTLLRDQEVQQFNVLTTPDDRAIAIKCLPILDQSPQPVDALQSVNEEAVLTALNDRLVRSGVQLVELRIRDLPDPAIYQPLLLFPALL